MLRTVQSRRAAQPILACAVLVATLLIPASGAYAAPSPAFEAWGETLAASRIESSPLFAQSLDRTIAKLESDDSEVVVADRSAQKTATAQKDGPAKTASRLPTLDYTCSGYTCGTTCGTTCASTCGYTCGTTCGTTCASTCGYTCVGGVTCGTTCSGYTCVGGVTCGTTCSGYTCVGGVTCGTTCSGTTCSSTCGTTCSSTCGTTCSSTCGTTCSSTCGTACGGELDDDIPGVALPASPAYGNVDASSDRDDVYAVQITAGQTLTVAMTGPTSADFDVFLFKPGTPSVSGPDWESWLVARSDSSAASEEITYTATATGTYYVDVYALSGAGTYTLTWSKSGDTNTPPVLAPIGNKTVNELALLTFTATATDADGDARTFSLGAGAPAGASITSGGTFSWTPSEAQGPGSYPITIIVSDEHGGTDSETITVTVNEVADANTPPVLGAIGNKTVNELALLTFTATATDADIPANTLTFSLGAGAPAGASITSGGAFTWTPSEAQGPGSYPVTVVVSDEHGATDSETITVTVNEVSTDTTSTYLSVRFAETTASSYGIPYGTSPYLTVQGILVELDNTAIRVTGQTVDLWTSFDGSNYTKSSATVSEDPDNPGLYSVRVLCTRRTWYRLRFGGSDAYERSLGRTLNAGPKAWLTAPTAPSTMDDSRSYSVYGYLKPQHYGSPVKIYAYQKVGGAWMARATFTAQASNYSTYSRYVGSIRLPYAGEWRIRAYHRDNAGGVHYASYSSWRYVTVK